MVAEEIGEIESIGNKQPKRLLILAVLLLSIAAVAAPILIARMTLFDEYGISKNTLYTHLVLPGVWSAVVLLIMALIIRTRIVGDLDVVWYRWSRSEVIKTILLIITTPLIYYPIGFLIHKLGLPMKENLYFWADQIGLSFYIILTIFSAVFVPILEELFWRGYIQRALERIFGGLAACLAQAVPFAAYHFLLLGGFLQVLVFGLAMGAWRWRRRTLLPIILAHIAVNSIWCADRWTDWLDCTRIKATTDYVAEFIEFSKPYGYDPNEDARKEYTKAAELVIELPQELKEVRKRYPTQWSKEERVRAEAWVTSNSEALDLVEKATQKPYYWVEYEHQSERMPPLKKGFDKMKDYASALCMRAMLKTVQGKHDQGFRDIETCYKLGKHLAANKEFVCRFAGYACRSWALQTTRMILAQEQIDGSLLNELQNQFEKFAEDDFYGFDFTSEILLTKDFIQCIFTDNGLGGGHIPKSSFIKVRYPDGEYEWTLLSFLPIENEFEAYKWRNLKRSKTTDQVELYYDLCQQACSQVPWQYRINLFVQMSIEKLKKQNPLIELYSPIIESLVHIGGRSPVDRDATITILAILRYEEDTRQFPDTLEQLVNAGYLKAIPDDAFYNGPLIYRRGNDDFILYSFGADFDDDGGIPSWWGEGEKGGDQVFWPVQESDANSESITELKQNNLN
jgi:membrane protease YdiL (CAAX protease family)